MSNEINKQIELYALVAEMEAMKGENAYRECVGQVVAYGEEAFCEIADKMRALRHEPVESKSPKLYASEINPKTDIWNLGLSFRSSCGLGRTGKKTLEDVTAMTEEELRGIRGIGEKSAQEIMCMLENYGYRMRSKAEEAK